MNDLYEQNQEYIDTIAELTRDKMRLQKQLDMAVNTLKSYANPNNWHSVNGYWLFSFEWEKAKQALIEIKEIDNENS